MSSNVRRREGSAAIEFALVGPVLILLLAGMMVYGGWLWAAQSVQSLATEAARAAVGGLDTAERITLARAFVTEAAPQTVGVDPARAAVEVTSDASAIRVIIRYDVRDHPLMVMSGLLPSPPPIIERSAVVRVGGY